MRVGPVSPSPAFAQPREVDARRTVASMSDIRAALGRALQSATGHTPSAKTLDVLSAQVSLETAHGQQMFNYNFGGIKGVSPRGETANYMTHEVLDGQNVHISQGFRAYGSLDEGARDYVAVMQARFPGALASARTGDLGGFAHALKQAHYYTAPEKEYAAGLRAAAPSSSGGPAAAVPLEPVPADFSTSDQVTRLMDALSVSAMHIADPEPKD